GAAQTFERASDELRSRLRQNLDSDVLRNQPALNQLPREVEVGLRSRRKPDLDLLEPNLQQLLEHPHLARRVHGLDQSLVAIAQIHTAPHRCCGQRPVGPGTVGQIDGRKRTILVGRSAQHGSDLTRVRNHEYRESPWWRPASIIWKSGLVGADRWRVGLLRLAAQKEKRKQQRRESAVAEGGVGVPNGDHGPTIALVRSGYKCCITNPVTGCAMLQSQG